MTTGRINQVTIVPGGQETPGAPPKGSGIVARLGAGRSPAPGPSHPWEAGAPTRHQAIRLPPLNSSDRGPPQAPRDIDWRCARAATYAAPVEIASHPVTPPRAATGFGEPPNNLQRAVANGQPSTDPFNALQDIRLAGITAPGRAARRENTPPPGPTRARNHTTVRGTESASAAWPRSCKNSLACVRSVQTR